jgi:hypothetical protein
VIPSLLGVADAAAPQWRHVPEAVRAATAGVHAPMVLAGHSGGGLPLPAIADAMTGDVAALVFVDSFLPPVTGSLTLAPRELIDQLRELATEGVLPPWSSWFGPDAMRERTGHTGDATRDHQARSDSQTRDVRQRWRHRSNGCRPRRRAGSRPAHRFGTALRVAIARGDARPFAEARECAPRCGGTTATRAWRRSQGAVQKRRLDSAQAAGSSPCRRQPKRSEEARWMRTPSTCRYGGFSRSSA